MASRFCLNFFSWLAQILKHFPKHPHWIVFDTVLRHLENKNIDQSVWCLMFGWLWYCWCLWNCCLWFYWCIILNVTVNLTDLSQHWVTCPRIMKICFGPNFWSYSIELYNDGRTSHPMLWQVSQVDGIIQIILKILFQVNIAFAEVLLG